MWTATPRIWPTIGMLAVASPAIFRAIEVPETAGDIREEELIGDETADIVKVVDERNGR